MAQSGPVYDNAMKALCTAVPVALCHWLGVEMAGEVEPIRISEMAPASAARHVDALVAVGSGLVVHIEFQSSGEARYGYRMLDYRVRLYARPEVRGKQLVQHVIMLAGGAVDEGISDDDLEYRYRVHYLRDQPVEPFLADPKLAPLAALANVSDRERPAVLRKVAALIATVEDLDLRRVLSEAAADLALLRLDVAIIKSTWEENAMSIPSFARALYEEELEVHRQRLREEARQEGREEGREQAREQLVAGMLRHRFGPDSRNAATARRLAALDDDELLRRLEQAATLDDLA